MTTSLSSIIDDNSQVNSLPSEPETQGLTQTQTEFGIDDGDIRTQRPLFYTHGTAAAVLPQSNFAIGGVRAQSILPGSFESQELPATQVATQGNTQQDVQDNLQTKHLPAKCISIPKTVIPEKSLYISNGFQMEARDDLMTVMPNDEADAQVRLKVGSITPQNQFLDSEVIIPGTQSSNSNSSSDVVHGTPTQDFDNCSKLAPNQQSPFQKTQNISDVCPSTSEIRTSPHINTINQSPILRKTQQIYSTPTQKILFDTSKFDKCQISQHSMPVNFRFNENSVGNLQKNKNPTKSYNFDQTRYNFNVSRNQSFSNGDDTQSICSLKLPHHVNNSYSGEINYSQKRDNIDDLKCKVQNTNDCLPSINGTFGGFSAKEITDDTEFNIVIPGTDESQDDSEISQPSLQSSLMNSSASMDCLHNDSIKNYNLENEDISRITAVEKDSDLSVVSNSQASVNFSFSEISDEGYLLDESENELNKKVSNSINDENDFESYINQAKQSYYSTHMLDRSEKNEFGEGISKSEKENVELNSPIKHSHKKQKTTEFSYKRDFSSSPSMPLSLTCSLSATKSPDKKHTKVRKFGFTSPVAGGLTMSFDDEPKLDGMFSSLQAAFLTERHTENVVQKRKIQSVWVRQNELFIPAQVLSYSEYHKLHHSKRYQYENILSRGEIPVRFSNGICKQVLSSNTIALKLSPGEKIRLKSDELLYEVLEVIDSDTDYGKSLSELYDEKTPFPEVWVQSSHSHVLPSRQSHSNDEQTHLQQFPSTILKNGNIIYSESDAKPSVNINYVIRTNDGGDKVVLKPIQDRKKAKIICQRSSSIVIASVCDIFLNSSIVSKPPQKGPNYDISALIPSTDTHDSFLDACNGFDTSLDPTNSFPRKNHELIQNDNVIGHQQSNEAKNSICQLNFASNNVNERVTNVLDRHKPKTPNFSTGLKSTHELQMQTQGIFSGCIFVIENSNDFSFGDSSWIDFEKNIESRGGIILKNGFSDIFDTDKECFPIKQFKTGAPIPNKQFEPIENHEFYMNEYISSGLDKLKGKMNISKEWNPLSNSIINEKIPNSNKDDSMGQPFRTFFNSSKQKFAALLANKANQKPKYMEALCLGYPCLSPQFIFDCIGDGKFLSNWADYMLSAGKSTLLKGAQKSLNVLTFQNLWEANKSLRDQFYARRLPFGFIKAPIYLIEDPSLCQTLVSKEDHDFYVVPDLVKNKYVSICESFNIFAKNNAVGGSIKSLDSTTDNDNKYYDFHTLLVLLGCKAEQIFFPTSLSEILVDKDEGAIIILTSYDKTPDEFNKSKSRYVLNCLKEGKSLKEQVLVYNREWMIQCIINQQLI